MPPGQRHTFILEELRKRELDKAELAQLCGVSMRTIHRDFQHIRSDPEYAWLECRQVWRFKDWRRECCD